jgi:hypothetical protein
LLFADVCLREGVLELMGCGRAVQILRILETEPQEPRRVEEVSDEFSQCLAFDENGG